MDAKEFNPGDLVEYDRCGFGKVISINPPRKITISFEDKGIQDILIPSSSLKEYN